MAEEWVTLGLTIFALILSFFLGRSRLEHRFAELVHGTITRFWEGFSLQHCYLIVGVMKGLLAVLLIYPVWLVGHKALGWGGDYQWARAAALISVVAAQKSFPLRGLSAALGGIAPIFPLASLCGILAYFGSPFLASRLVIRMMIVLGLTGFASIILYESNIYVGASLLAIFMVLVQYESEMDEVLGEKPGSGKEIQI